MDYKKTILTTRYIVMQYTCVDYRSEMRLLGPKRKLEEKDLSEEKKELIVQEIQELEKVMRIN